MKPTSVPCSNQTTRRRLRLNRRAMVLMVVLIIGMLLIVTAVSLFSVSAQQMRNRYRYEVYKDEFAAAEAALNRTYSHIQFLVTNKKPDFNDKMAAMTSPVMAGYTFNHFSLNQVSDQLMPDPNLNGYNTHQVTYQIEVTAHKDGGNSTRLNHPGVTLSQQLTVSYVPLFLFAIFYDPAMEIGPGALMNINGLVHTNGDAYISSGAGLNFNKNVTIAGRFYRGRSGKSGQSDAGGDVSFNNGKSQVSMKVKGRWLDSKDKNWTGEAQAAWNGGLRDNALGVSSMSLPITTGLDPHSIIERASASDNASLKAEKFENKASMKILCDASGNVTGYTQNPETLATTPVSLTYPDPAGSAQTKSVVSKSTFYDARESKMVTTVDVNVGNMIESGIMPENGVVYVSNEDSGSNVGAVRLVNGSTVPVASGTTGFTVASDDPVYVQGNYNSANKAMALIAADAISILSNAWKDTNAASAKSSLSNRMASATTVNAVCMQGIIPSANSNYSGGVENYFRLLEDWNGKTYTFNGSIINLWQSQRVTGKWQPTGKYYNPPARNWSWDTIYGGANGPPGSPYVLMLSRGRWQQGGGH